MSKRVNLMMSKSNLDLMFLERERNLERRMGSTAADLEVSESEV